MRCRPLFIFFFVAAVRSADIPGWEPQPPLLLVMLHLKFPLIKNSSLYANSYWIKQLGPKMFTNQIHFLGLWGIQMYSPLNIEIPTCWLMVFTTHHACLYI